MNRLLYEQSDRKKRKKKSIEIILFSWYGTRSFSYLIKCSNLSLRNVLVVSVGHFIYETKIQYEILEVKYYNNNSSKSYDNNFNGDDDDDKKKLEIKAR